MATMSIPLRNLIFGATLGVGSLAASGYGAVRWYRGFLDRFPPDFEPPLDPSKTAFYGRPTPVGGWGGGGGGVSHVPVVFLHGTTGAGWNWGVARAFFRRWGYQPDELWALTYGWDGARHVDPNGVETVDDSVDENVSDLDEFVRAVFAYVQRRNPAIQQIDIVSHSMGGVLARRWIQQCGTAGLVRHLVTLDSPHHGVHSYWLRKERCPGELTRFCEEFLPDSQFLQQLNGPGLGEAPPGVRTLAIYDGTGDISFIGTPLSPALKGAVNLPYNLVHRARLTHRDYLLHPRVLRIVYDFLNE